MFQMPTLFRLLPLSLALAAAIPASAQSLTDLYGAARGYDASYQSAKSQLEATRYKAEQAKAANRPSVALQTTLSRTINETSAATDSFSSNSGASTTQTATSANSSTHTGTTDARLGISLQHAIFNRSNDYSIAQAERAVESSDIALKAAEQDLMVRVGQAYFDALNAQDTLSLVQMQKAAVAEQLASAKRNFEVGTATITDTKEAQARHDLVVAQEIAAENDLMVKRKALDQLVGTAGNKPIAGASGPEMVPPQGDDAQWVASALANNPQIRALGLARDIARMEAEKAEAGHLPTLAWTASYSRNIPQGNSTTSTDSRSVTNGAAVTNTSSTSASSPNQTNTTNIGLVLSIPLYQGNAITNRVRETVSLQAKADTDLEASKRSIAQGVRTAFFGVQSGLAQIKALEAAEASSQSALDANKLGYQVGVRINIDVLNSQSQLFDTKTKLAKARYDVLLGGLKLRQAAGVLQANDLDTVSKLLAP